MKKIVSTMFKCGAICASLTTAFANEPEIRSIQPDASADSRGEPLSNLLAGDDSRDKLLHLLSIITGNLINHHGEPISLLPSDIRIDGEKVYFPKSQEQPFGDIRDLMQIKKNGSPNQALASLAFYILNPWLRVCFEENRIRVVDGIFEFFCFPRDEWVQNRAEYGCVYITIIQLLYNNKIPIKLFKSYIKNYTNIMTLLKAIQESMMYISPEERQKAREYIKEARQEFLELLYRYSPSMMNQFYLLKAAELEKKKDFYELAKEFPIDAIVLLKGCSTVSIEECRRTGRIQISPNAMEIFENWRYNELVDKLKIAVNGFTRDMRSTALNEAIEIYDCNAPEQQERLEEDYPELLPMATLIQSLDLEDGTMFLRWANSYPIKAFDILSKYFNGEIQFSPTTEAIICLWIDQYLASDLPNTILGVICNEHATTVVEGSGMARQTSKRNP
ncbi:MAG: hypothetical protein ACSW8C_03960 [bacterium]